MAGIPKRRAMERSNSYRRRVLDAEHTRRDWKLIHQLEAEHSQMMFRHTREMDEMMAELVRAYRAKPGSKYDITARKKRK